MGHSHVRNVEVGGSSPLTSTQLKDTFSPLTSTRPATSRTTTEDRGTLLARAGHQRARMHEAPGTTPLERTLSGRSGPPLGAGNSRASGSEGIGSMLASAGGIGTVAPLAADLGWANDGAPWSSRTTVSSVLSVLAARSRSLPRSAATSSHRDPAIAPIGSTGRRDRGRAWEADRVGWYDGDRCHEPVRYRPVGWITSSAEFVKSATRGATAKLFNVNVASLYGRLGQARVRPSNLWSVTTRRVSEQLNRDAGYDPGQYRPDRERCGARTGA